MTFNGGNKSMWRLRMTFFVLALMFTAGAFAQGGGNVAITGTVLDPSGAVVPGANITVTQKSTSAVRTVTTNSSGQFNFPSLPPATYTVSVQATGFKQYVQDVVLLADQIRDMDVKLQVGAATQQVTVEESAVAGQHREPGAQPGD